MFGRVPRICSCFFLSGHSLWGRKTHKENPPKIPGQSRENFDFFRYQTMSAFSRVLRRRLQGLIVKTRFLEGFLEGSVYGRRLEGA